LKVPLNQIRIFYVAKRTVVVTKSKKQSHYSKMCENDWWNKHVFSLWQKSHLTIIL